MVAPRIVNDVSYVTRINHEIYFAGAVFGEVGVSLFVAGAALREIWIDSRRAPNVVFFHTKCVSKMGRVRSPKRRVRGADFIFGSCSDHGRIVFILAEAIQGFSADILNSEFPGRRRIW